jgi:hypothetical protein
MIDSQLDTIVTILITRTRLHAIRYEDKRMACVRIWKAINRTDKTMTKAKMTIGQTTIYKTLHRTLMIEQHEPY